MKQGQAYNEILLSEDGGRHVPVFVAEAAAPSRASSAKQLASLCSTYQPAALHLAAATTCFYAGYAQCDSERGEPTHASHDLKGRPSRKS